MLTVIAVQRLFLKAEIFVKIETNLKAASHHLDSEFAVN